MRRQTKTIYTAGGLTMMFLLVTAFSGWSYGLRGDEWLVFLIVLSGAAMVGLAVGFSVLGEVTPTDVGLQVVAGLAMAAAGLVWLEVRPGHLNLILSLILDALILGPLLLLARRQWNRRELES